MGHSICSVDGFHGVHMDHIIQVYESSRRIDKRPILIIIIIVLYCTNIRECSSTSSLCRDGIGCFVFSIHCMV